MNIGHDPVNIKKKLVVYRNYEQKPEVSLGGSPRFCSIVKIYISQLQALSQWITVRFFCQYSPHFFLGLRTGELPINWGCSVCASESALNNVMSYRGARQESSLVI